MKHKFEKGVDVNLNIDIPVDDLGDLIDDSVDKIVNGAVTVIVIATAAHILKSWLS